MGRPSRENEGLLGRLSDRSYDALEVMDDWKKIGEDAVLALLKALMSTEEQVRSNAARTLGALGFGARKSVPALIDTLRDESDLARLSASAALANIGEEAQEAVPILVTMLADASGSPPEFCDAGTYPPEWLINSLHGFGDVAVPDLVKALSHESERIRLGAAISLNRIEPKNVKRMDSLTAALKDTNIHIAELAAGALSRIVPPQACEAAAALADSMINNKRLAAIAAYRLEALGATKENIPILVEALHADEWNIRAFAASILGGLGSDGAQVLPVLRDLLVTEEQEEVQGDLTEAIELIERAAGGAAVHAPVHRPGELAPATSKKELLKRLEAADLQRLAADLEPNIRPSIRITTRPVKQEQLALGESRIGGQPDLPQDCPWPTRNDRKLDFVAQIRLEDIASCDIEHSLPSTGWLYFFYDIKFYEVEVGEGIGQTFWQVIYHRGDVDSLKTCPIPFGRDECDDEEDGWHRPYGGFKPCRLELFTEWMLPPFASNSIQPKIFDDDQWERYCNLSSIPTLTSDPGNLSTAKSGGHRMLGHPNPVQDSVEWQSEIDSRAGSGEEWFALNEAAAKEERKHPGASEVGQGARRWRLLLQLDSDDNAGMTWADVGALYFMIPEASLSAGDFEAVQLVRQA